MRGTFFPAGKDLHLTCAGVSTYGHHRHPKNEAGGILLALEGYGFCVGV
jgi:hypothetical protein